MSLAPSTRATSDELILLIGTLNQQVRLVVKEALYTNTDPTDETASHFSITGCSLHYLLG